MRLDIKHGGHLMADKSERAVQLARMREDVRMAEDAAPPESVEFMTPFDYLFPGLTGDPASHLPADDPAQTVAALKALGDAMIDEATPEMDNSIIPPVYTYWGQFTDHDLTANTDRDSAVSDITKPDLAPLPPEFVVENLKNLRQPTLNLDSVYGDGPGFGGHPTAAAELYDGIRLKVGTNATGGAIPGEVPPPAEDLMRDLPRVDKKAQIGDARNDENLIVAQFHTAFLRFHNAVVDWVEENEAGYKRDAKLFERARELTRWHYQWLVVHDYLETVTAAGTVDRLLYGGLKHYAPRDGTVFMPLEFSVAAYRFGHSMVRAEYDFNRNFGRGSLVLPRASFELIFQFTGDGFPEPFLGQGDTLPFNWIIEWDRFVDKGSTFPDRFARKIDTRLAPPLATMINQGNRDGLGMDVRALLKHLAKRNLLRGYLLSMPTGQAVAQAMEVEPLSASEILQGNSAALNQILTDNGFVERTPLWYYVLKEAEVRADGNSLGELGSRLVAETVIGLIEHDPESYRNQEGGWDPSKGVRLPNGDPIVTIRDFLRFADVLP